MFIIHQSHNLGK